jgi:hypothetical protein
MSNQGLQDYLEQLADGNESVRRDFYEILAQSVVYIPAIVKENDKLVRCIVSMMQDYSRPTIPVFLNEKEVAEWNKEYSSLNSNETVIALLAADLCSSLDLNTQLAVSPGSNTVLLIGPEQVDSIASTPFDPPIALESSEILKKPKETKSQPKINSDEIIPPQDRGEINLELSPLFEDNENIGNPSDINNHDITSNPIPIFQQPQTQVQAIDPELSGTLILQDNDTPPSDSSAPNQDQEALTPLIDDGKTQFLRPLKKINQINSEPNKFVQQPRRKFGERQ